MANSKIPYVTLATAINSWRERFNHLLDSVGDVSTLTTSANDVTSAVNELDSIVGGRILTTFNKTIVPAVNELDSEIGDEVLTTTNGTIKGAINELDSEIGNETLTTTSGTVKGAINEIDLLVGSGTLTTTSQNLVGAINELDFVQGNASLFTTNQTLTGAVNELYAIVSVLDSNVTGSFDSAFGNIGDLGTLTTTAKNNVVAAINELDGRLDSNDAGFAARVTGIASAVVSDLDYRDSGDSAELLILTLGNGTVYKETVHMNSKVGKLSDLTTTASSSIVDAVNELDRRMPDIYDRNGTLLNT